MLNSDIAAFREDLLARDKASIIEIAVENYSIRSDMEARLHVMEQISRDMSLQYDEMRNLLKCREYETEELRNLTFFVELGRNPCYTLFNRIYKSSGFSFTLLLPAREFFHFRLLLD